MRIAAKAFLAGAALLAAAEAAASAPAMPAPGSLPGVSIRYREHSVVDGPAIRLGDIARIIAGEEKVVARLESLVVAQAAGFGLTRVLDTDLLYARHLKPLAGTWAIDAERKTIRVETRAATLPAEALNKAVDAFLAAEPRREGQTWKWEIARAPGEVKVPTVPHTLEVSFASQRRKGKVDLKVAIRAEGRLLRTLPVTVNLRVLEDVLVATRAIVRDEPLGEANVRLERRETTHMDDMASADPSRLMGRLAKAGIAPGRVVTPRLVAMAPAVRRGQEAKLVYRNGEVNITAGAVCRQDGIPGQIITAKSLVTQRLLRVRVTENGLLEPVPGG